MKISAALLALALSIPAICSAKTLCQKEEITYFSCQAKNSGKFISVCGNIPNGKIDDDSWLQYRYGKPRAIELTYPEEKSDSVSKFEGNHFNRYSVIDLRFINGKTLYGVTLAGTFSGEGANPRSRASGSVYVETSKSKHISIACQDSSIDKYYDIFAELNDSLRYRNGETDLLYHFYNHVSK